MFTQNFRGVLANKKSSHKLEIEHLVFAWVFKYSNIFTYIQICGDNNFDAWRNVYKKFELVLNKNEPINHVRLRWSAKCLAGRFVERRAWNFTIGRSHEIRMNFSKICIKIIKNIENYGENFRKMQISHGNFLFVLARWEKELLYTLPIMEPSDGESPRC